MNLSRQMNDAVGKQSLRPAFARSNRQTTSPIALMRMCQVNPMIAAAFGMR